MSKKFLPPVLNYHELQFNPKVDKETQIKEKDIFDDNVKVDSKVFSANAIKSAELIKKHKERLNKKKK